jgi:hypothetical protein
LRLISTYFAVVLSGCCPADIKFEMKMTEDQQAWKARRKVVSKCIAL